MNSSAHLHFKHLIFHHIQNTSQSSTGQNVLYTYIKINQLVATIFVTHYEILRTQLHFYKTCLSMHGVVWGKERIIAEMKAQGTELLNLH